MTRWLSKVMLYLAVPCVLLWSGGHIAAQTLPGSAPEAKDEAERVRRQAEFDRTKKALQIAEREEQRANHRLKQRESEINVARLRDGRWELFAEEWKTKGFVDPQRDKPLMIQLNDAKAREAALSVQILDVELQQLARPISEVEAMAQAAQATRELALQRAVVGQEINYVMKQIERNALFDEINRPALVNKPTLTGRGLELARARLEQDDREIEVLRLIWELAQRLKDLGLLDRLIDAVQKRDLSVLKPKDLKELKPLGGSGLWTQFENALHQLESR